MRYEHPLKTLEKLLERNTTGQLLECLSRIHKKNARRLRYRYERYHTARDIAKALTTLGGKIDAAYLDMP